MASLSFLLSVPENKTVPLSCSQLWTRHFGLFGTNLPQPRHRSNSICSMPCSCGPAQLLPHTVLDPRTEAWVQVQGPYYTVWEDRYPSNESHSHLYVPAAHLSYFSCTSIAPSSIFVCLSLLLICASQRLTPCFILLGLSRTSCGAWHQTRCDR